MPAFWNHVSGGPLVFEIWKWPGGPLSQPILFGSLKTSR